MTATQAFFGISAFVLSSVLIAAQADKGEFKFAILGDRTGGAQPGVYEEAWRETAADHPAFVVTVGDTIEGGDDMTMDAEWRHVMNMLLPYRKHSGVLRARQSRRVVRRFGASI